MTGKSIYYFEGFFEEIEKGIYHSTILKVGDIIFFDRRDKTVRINRHDKINGNRRIVRGIETKDDKYYFNGSSDTFFVLVSMISSAINLSINRFETNNQNFIAFQFIEKQ